MDFKSGHGVTLAMEKVSDPGGTFTPVPGVDVNLGWTNSREESVIRPHEHGVPVKILSNVQDMNDLALSGVFDEDEATHDSTTGLYAHYLGVGGTPGRANVFGLQLRGPDSTGAGDNEIIVSGGLKSFMIDYPAGAGAKRFTATFSVSGPYIVDGVLYS